MVLPVPMHKFEPTPEQPIIRYVQPIELITVLRDLIMKEQEITQEQILVVRLHKWSDGEWQPTLSWFRPSEKMPQSMGARPVLEIGQPEPVVGPATNTSSAQEGGTRQTRAGDPWSEQYFP